MTQPDPYPRSPKAMTKRRAKKLAYGLAAILVEKAASHYPDWQALVQWKLQLTRPEAAMVAEQLAAIWEMLEKKMSPEHLPLSGERQ